MNGILREISAAVWAGQPSEGTTEIHPRHGFKRGPRGAHHHVHDSRQWYLLLSLLMRLLYFSVCLQSAIHFYSSETEKDEVDLNFTCC